MLTFLKFSEYENDKQVGENFIDCSKGKTEQQIEKVGHHIGSLQIKIDRFTVLNKIL